MRSVNSIKMTWYIFYSLGDSSHAQLNSLANWATRLYSVHSFVPASRNTNASRWTSIYPILLPINLCCSIKYNTSSWVVSGIKSRLCQSCEQFFKLPQANSPIIHRCMTIWFCCSSAARLRPPLRKCLIQTEVSARIIFWDGGGGCRPVVVRCRQAEKAAWRLSHWFRAFAQALSAISKHLNSYLSLKLSCCNL